MSSARPSTEPAATPSASLVRTRGLEVRYTPETHIVLPDIGLEAGQELALVGPSGSGKTTLLHMLAGLLAPSTGSVWLGDTELTALPRRRLEHFRARNIGIVFQDFHLIDGYSALDNVVVALAAAGYSISAARKRAGELLHDLDVGHRAAQTTRRLSTGERQRVAIARAVAAGPKLLLADEPTANLDQKRAEHALALLRDAAKKADAALIVSTHDPAVREVFDERIELR